MQGVYVVIPVYNEAPVLASVLSGVRAHIPPQQVIVVNDGSQDASASIAESFGCHVLHHRMNRGLGAALKTGLTFAHELGANVMVTFDGDGQHNAVDIARVADPLLAGSADMVIGSRFLRQEKMPLHRRIFNWLGNAVTWLFHGRWVSDSQSGLRALSSRVLPQMNIRANHMEVSSEFIAEAHRLQLRIVEVPITPVYTEYSLSKGQSFLGGVRTVVKIAVRKFL